MKVKLTLEELARLDNGKVAAVFARELRHVTKDCLDRPTDESARKITMVISVKPQECDGVCETVEAEVSIKSHVPDRRTRPYQLAVNGRGDVIVNDASPEDIRQATLDEAGTD